MHSYIKMKSKKKPLIKKIEIEQSINVEVNNNAVTIKGEKGEISRKFNSKSIIIKTEENKIIVDSIKEKKKEKKMVNTIVAHLKNMIKGVTKGFEYELSAVFKHFPMTLEVKNNKVLIKNFLGEKVPRECEIVEGVNVNLTGQKFILSGIDKEKVGSMASRLELITRVTKMDRRIFQDGIFITRKDNKII